MKGRDIKRQLKNDISSASNSSFSAIMERCEGESVQSEAMLVTPEGHTSTEKSRRWIYVALAMLALFFVIYAIIFFNQKSPEDPFIPPTTKSSGYFVIDINPSVKISYDENGIVTGATALNEDAEVLLYGLDVSSKTPEEAIGILFDRCVELGYFSAERDNNAVLASAMTSEGARDEEMTRQIKELFSNKFSSKKMLGVVITGAESNALDGFAEQYGVDSQKYALIMYYLELGGVLDTASYSQISVSELYERIRELEKLKKAQDIAKAQDEAKNAEGKLFKSLADSIEALVLELEACIARADGDEMSPPNGPSDRVPPSVPNEIGKPSKLTLWLAMGHGKERYEGFKGRFDEYLLELKRAEEASDCKSAVEQILVILNEMKADESDEALIALIDETILQIELLFEQFEIASATLSSLNATIEEQSSARAEAFKDAPMPEHENVEQWQRSKEAELASQWYEHKKQWDNERKNDLMGGKK